MAVLVVDGTLFELRCRAQRQMQTGNATRNGALLALESDGVIAFDEGDFAPQRRHDQNLACESTLYELDTLLAHRINHRHLRIDRAAEATDLMTPISVFCLKHGLRMDGLPHRCPQLLSNVHITPPH